MQLPPELTREYGNSNYELESNSDYLNFQKVEVTSVDDSKPWKPPLEVSVTKADGTVVDKLDASTPFFTFKDRMGNVLTVSAADAGHIDSLHIKGEDPGSIFDEPSLEALMKDAAAKMPEGIAEQPGVSAFDVEMGKSMGREGIANLQELVRDGVLTEQDVEAAMALKNEVKALNKEGTKEEKDAFIQAHNGGKVGFQLIRGDVLVPIVNAPKRPTTKLFMVFGPGKEGAPKTMYTAAPGRFMPKHPNPGQHKNKENVLDEKTFDESAEAWFNTVMLTGK